MGSLILIHQKTDGGFIRRATWLIYVTSQISRCLSASTQTDDVSSSQHKAAAATPTVHGGGLCQTFTIPLHCYSGKAAAKHRILYLKMKIFTLQYKEEFLRLYGG